MNRDSNCKQNSNSNGMSKKVIVKKTNGPFKHSACGKLCRDAWEVKREKNCRECNRILLERSRTMQTDHADEVAALREEVTNLKALVLRLCMKVGVDCFEGNNDSMDSDVDGSMKSDDDDSMDGEEDGSAMASDEDKPPQHQPRPKSITIRGHGSDYGLACGDYVPYDRSLYKNHYVSKSALMGQIRKHGHPEEGFASVLNRPHLTFRRCGGDDDDDAPGYYLVAVKHADDNRGFAKEMPDGSWCVWDLNAKAWTAIPSHVPPLLAASYSV